jgi:hypothetical protein
LTKANSDFGNRAYTNSPYKDNPHHRRRGACEIRQGTLARLPRSI